MKKPLQCEILILQYRKIATSIRSICCKTWWWGERHLPLLTKLTVNMQLYQSSFSNYWQIFQIYTSLFVFFDFPHFYDELILCRILLFLGTLRSIPQNLLCIEGSSHFSHLLQIFKICLDFGVKITAHGQKVQPLQANTNQVNTIKAS